LSKSRCKWSGKKSPPSSKRVVRFTDPSAPQEKTPVKGKKRWTIDALIQDEARKALGDKHKKKKRTNRAEAAFPGGGGDLSPLKGEVWGGER